MSKSMNRKEGIGSYFHFEDSKYIDIDRILLNFDYQIFYTGRQALLHILNEINNKITINKIWFPNYYCQHTLGWIKKSYPNISIYEINPFEFASDKIEINGFAEANDVVLINNYWGLSTINEKRKDSPIIIEDHSHGWLSHACLNSKADYCFASLRKSLPVPLGGIYWKPGAKVSNIEYNYVTDTTFYEIWNLMLRAMQFKSKYIHGDFSKGPSEYIPLFYEVEEAIDNYTEFVCLKKQHKTVIDSYLNLNTKKIKDENLEYLYCKIKDTSSFKVIKRSGYSAFGFHLLFEDINKYYSLKEFLVNKNIYPSSLWPDNNIEYQWRYFLNIHVDYRYTIKDMDYIAYTINNWLENYQ